MTVDSAANLLLALTSLLTLGWAITVQLRNTSSRKHAERAATAAQLLETLGTLGLAGMDVRLDEPAALSVHNAQLRELQQIIRVNARDFSDRAQHPGLPVLLHLYAGFVGVMLIFGGVQMTLKVIDVAAPNRSGAVVVAGCIMLAGVLFLGASGIALWRRYVARERRRAAGIHVPSLVQVAKNELRDVQWVMAQTWARLRDRNREAGSRVRTKSAKSPTPDHSSRPN